MTVKKVTFLFQKRKNYFLFFTKKIHKKQPDFTAVNETAFKKNQTMIDFLT